MNTALKLAVAVCLLAVVLICVLVTVGITENTGYKHIQNETCTRLDGTLGDCVDIQECELLKFTNETPSSYDDPRNRCGAGVKSVRVCCPRKVEVEPSKPEELLPLDTCGKADYDDKVSYGNVANLFEYPWMAQLAYKTMNGLEYLCSGTLITDRYVLTAGHCVPPIRGNRKLLYVRLGEYNMSSPIDCFNPPFEDKICAEAPQDIEIESKILHPKFDRVQLLNDIALLRLKRKANTSVESVKPICLPILPSVANVNLTRVTVTGWGLTEKNKISDVLLRGNIRVMDNEPCRKLYKSIKVTETHFCVGDNTRVASCQGDSGGPLQTVQDFNNNTRYVQYGVVSQGPAICGADGLPGIHTRIEFYLDWIISNIKP